MSQFWYCVRHKRVEDETNLCPPIDRLGPYASREEAEHALEAAERRNEEWDKDPVWNDDVDE
ncbi:SPOR domain-containing protein [Nocardioides sp. T2.26MG-1]|uniref:SPOR domain-containing protein n=1 Tax=Nocardioides sp. T2.26MG-1 TaxID=3041166 RepID=UPI002477823C|nr:SPOR domain-containing protein [Nocardioides sp. T2.26MG-1]CAI9404321.1 hypothetical protein HIDPHFAB_04156 [Nocardioides sp. T2.26MG-1]